MVIPVGRIPEEKEEEGSGDSDVISSVEDLGESSSRSLSDMFSSAHTRSRSLPPSPSYSRFCCLSPPPPPARSHGKAKTTKDRETFYKGFGVVYIPGNINELTRKLHLLGADFFAGNTTRIGSCIGRIA